LTFLDVKSNFLFLYKKNRGEDQPNYSPTLGEEGQPEGDPFFYTNVWLQKKVLQQKKEKKKPTMEGGGERQTSFMWRKTRR